MSRHMRIPISLIRATGEGYWQGGDWNDSGTTECQIKGDIQPAGGLLNVVAPNGYSTTDSIKIFSKSEIRTVRDFGNAKADYVVLQGRKYIAFKIMNNTYLKMRTKHYEVLFLREDKPKKGGI